MTEKETLCRAVRHIAWGYVLLHVDITIGAIDLLPAWAGYLLMLGALPDLARVVREAALLRPLGWLLAGWTGVQWLTNVLSLAAFPYAVELVAAVLELYFHFQLLTDLARLAESQGCPQGPRILRLRTVRTLLTTATALLAGRWPDVPAIALTVLFLVYVVVALWICRVLFSLDRSLRAEPPDASAADAGPQAGSE